MFNTFSVMHLFYKFDFFKLEFRSCDSLKLETEFFIVKNHIISYSFVIKMNDITLKKEKTFEEEMTFL